MVVDKSKVATTRHVRLMSSHGHHQYTRLHLASITGREQVEGGERLGDQPQPVTATAIHEDAHRIVLWAMHGPPPAFLRHPVAMHACHNATCISPSHMVWGERYLNRTAAADAHAQDMMRQQLR